MSDTEEESTCSDSWPINEDWLMDVLKKHHEVHSGIKITHFKVKQGCQDGVNNLSDILSVSVVYAFERNEPVSGEVSQCLDIVIKLLPQDPFSRYFVTEAQFDLREIKFYTSILPDLMAFQEQYIPKELGSMVISVPTCFYTQYAPLGSNTPTSLGSPDTAESILVLEDMRSLGYKGANFTTGLTLGQTEAAIRAIVTIHALSLGLKIKKKVDLNEKYPFLFQTKRATESYQQLVEQGMPQLTKFLEQKPGFENELKALSKIRPQTKYLIEKLLQPIEPMGLITHTDFWCNNLLFRGESDDERTDSCIILDWQMVTYSRLTNDLALLLISSIPSSTRRQNTSRLLDLYYGTLKSCCLKMDVDIEADLGYSRNKMDCEYRHSLLLALLLCIGSVDIAIGNPAAEQRLLDVLRDLYDEGILCPCLEQHDRWVAYCDTNL
uniref:CHK kinase-like domain-containing protein n=1 Tax=Anopheles farauti TaxID=69004 RepID=A0A182Q1Z2_9DIPT